MDAVERKIDHLDVQTLSPEDRESFTIALENLKQTGSQGFSPPAPTPPGMRVRTGRFTEIAGP
jgi:hypothetical protein